MNLATDVVEFCICVIDRNLSFERFIELHFCPSKAEALWLGRDLEAAPIPLHDVVVADRALVMKAADALQIFGSGTPGLFGFARHTGEATAVVGKKIAQDLVGREQVVGASQAQFAGEAILKSAPETFNAALGLRTLRGDVSDAQLLESAAALRGLAASGELFFHRPVIVVADEDAVSIAVEADGNAEAAQ